MYLEDWSVTSLHLFATEPSFWLLAENPDIGKACDEVRDGYRKFPQGSHVIFYRQIGSQSIEIIRILHKSMDVNPIFGA
ncbi:plasmid stabilization protein ParE [Vibrio parahaemolyticus]|nr:plasmid stabilization protein ParE [Vibrio parahaemolyticus]